MVIFFENSEISNFADHDAVNLEDIYQTTVRKNSWWKKNLIRREPNTVFKTIISTPEELSINTINKYLELKARIDLMRPLPNFTIEISMVKSALRYEKIIPFYYCNIRIGRMHFPSTGYGSGYCGASRKSGATCKPDWIIPMRRDWVNLCWAYKVIIPNYGSPENENWGLAKFEIQNWKKILMISKPLLPTGRRSHIYDDLQPLKDLHRHQSKNKSAFEAAYLIDDKRLRNSCHEQSRFGFNHILVPASKCLSGSGFTPVR